METKKEEKNHFSIEIDPLDLRPPATDLNHFWFVKSYGGHDYRCQFWWIQVTWFGSYRGSFFWLSPLNRVWTITLLSPIGLTVISIIVSSSVLVTLFLLVSQS